MIRALAALSAIALLAACAVERPPSVACPGLTVADETPVTVSTQGASPPEAIVNRMAAAIDVGATDPVADAMRAEAARTAPSQAVRFRVVTLSAGGQFGAFGAGFLAGWGTNPATPRPTFDVVTGVSAGAILAPVAFAGPAFDDALAFYRGLGADGVLRRRPILSVPRAPSLATPEPLEAFLEREVDAELVAAIAGRHAAGDQVLIAATNIDTTEEEFFDLGAVAATADPGQATTCIREAMLASAAIPGLLPPRHINGALYADGGLRDQVFFRAVDTARARVARETGRDIRVEAYLVVNGSLRPPIDPARDSLLGYIGRSVEILADEVLRDSVLEAVAFARERPEWRLRGVVSRADVAATCGVDSIPSGTFDPCITRALYDEGAARGRRAPIDWLDADALEALAAEL